MVTPGLLEKALRISVLAHHSQKRKEADIPYIAHPVAVALKLMQNGFPDVVVAAGLVHDVLEDTDVKEGNLRKELGDDVVDIVKAVTYDETLSWEEQREKFAADIQKSSVDVKAVAIVDKIHNAESLLLAYQEQGPGVWRHFNRGKEKKLWFEHLMLSMFKKTWQHPLVAEYAALVKKLEDLKEA